MESESSINEPEKQENSLIRRVIIGGIIVAAAALIPISIYYYFFRRGDPPPIIVKTGSLIFHSKKPMKQKALNGYTYTVENFGVDFKGVKIKNLSVTVPDKDYDNKGGVLEVEAALQKFEGGTWVNFDTLFLRAAGAGSQKDFAIQTKIDLERKNDPPPKYPDKWEDAGTYRFKEITVRVKGEPDTPPINVGNNYAICLYNSLEMDGEDCK